MSSSLALATHSGLGRRYKNLYNSQKFTDCTFQIDERKINCHRLILAAASPVFEAMFYGPMSDEKCVEISDISQETFELMIEYIYAGEIDFKKISLETIIELYYSSEKYIINDLICACLNEIRKKLEFKNILPALDLSVFMGLQPLLTILITFLNKYCLNGYQFMNNIENNYYHVSRDCLKIIIDAIKDSEHVAAVWFIQFWCRNECKSLGLNENEYSTILKDLDCNFNGNTEIKTISINGNIYIPNYVERIYYKACRPFVISNQRSEFSVKIKSDRLITLLGLTMHGRIIPRISLDSNICEHDYTESFDMHIWSNNCVLIHRQKVHYPKINYNCDIIINLYKNITLSPGFEYEVKIMWDESAYGAEYPCSLYSNEIRGISFTEDQYLHNDGGTIFKGIRYLNSI